MKTYRVKTSHILSNSIYFIFPLVMTVIAITEDQAVQPNEWVGVGVFWLIGILVLVLLSGSKVVVGSDYIQPYLFGLSRKKIKASDVEVLEYGSFFRGGLGVGKGLKIWVKNPNGARVYRSIGEKAYGAEAIESIRKALAE